MINIIIKIIVASLVVGYAMGVPYTLEIITSLLILLSTQWYYTLFSFMLNPPESDVYDNEIPDDFNLLEQGADRVIIVASLWFLINSDYGVVFGYVLPWAIMSVTLFIFAWISVRTSRNDGDVS